MEKISEYEFTLGLVVSHDCVLLAEKQKKIGAGYYLGPGGKIEVGEEPEEAMARELYQEMRLSAMPADITRAGILYSNDFVVYVFLIDSFSGVPHSTDEMKNPRWFPVSEIIKAKPFYSGRKIREMKICAKPGDLFPPDRGWMPYALPHILAGQNMIAKIAWRTREEGFFSVSSVVICDFKRLIRR